MEDLVLDHVKIRKGQPDPHLSEEDFKTRYKYNFYDPRFASKMKAIDEIAEIAWQNYNDHRKAPITAKAGPGFQDPNYDLSVEWSETRRQLLAAEEQRKTAVQPRILIINGSPRNEHTCPGEESKSWRMVQMAKDLVEKNQMTPDILDLSTLTAEYGKEIHPCKACVSTAMPLCHWPCSCYPNHSLGQATDWMAEIYEQWVRADGILIMTPTHWYQVPSVFKLMMDRLVCADGGNTDPTSTHGKNAEEAKKIELKGWDFPKHLAGRAYGVVAHGDSTGVETVKRILVDWLNDMELVQASHSSCLDSYIGYYKPYATSHDDYDKDKDLKKEIENAVLALIHQVHLMKNGQFIAADAGLNHVMKK
jgi:multimeric flavodoxin WrbA